jgi:hypothetical protein
MTKQEFLTIIFKANKAKELTFENILHMVMSAKKTTDPAKVDIVGLIETLQDMINGGIIHSWTKRTKQHVDAPEWDDTPVFVMIG